jgi:hypothetical protein
MTKSSLAQVSQAIELLFDKSTPQTERTEADVWLQGFQSSPEAWIVSDAFLNEDPSSSQVAAQRVLFTALTLQKKIGTHFAQLPTSSYESLRDTLIAHISRFSQTVTLQIIQNPEEVCVKKSSINGRDESPTILRNLCIAFASLLIQTGAPPALALRDLCLQLPIPEGSVALLEILRALPEELDSRSRKFRNSAASNSAVEAHKDMQRMLTLCAPDVLLLLLSIMKANVQTQYMSIYAGVFFALASWVSSAKDPIPANLLAESGLLQACIEALLKYPQLFDSASLLLQEVIGRYPRFKASSDSPVAEIILPGILSLEPLFINAHAKGEAGDDECLVLSKLFSEAAYCYLYWMLRPSDEAGMTILTSGAPGGPQMTEYRNRYINVLSRCMSHPNNNVAGATFRFWLMMRDVFQRDPTELARKDESHIGRDFRNLLKQSLAPSLMVLAKLVVQRLRFPSGNAWTDIPDDLKDEFRHQFRYDCHDTLLLCSSVTGYKDVLSFLAHSLQTELGTFSAMHQLSGQRMDSPGWEGVESCLYGIRCISKDVPPEEEEVMPSVFELLPRLPPHTELQATCFRIMGYYAPWLRAHESSVPTVVDYICTHGVAVQTPSGGVPLASPPQECAARALREIGKKCLSTAAPQLLSLPGRANLLAIHVMNFKQTAAIIIEAIATFSNDKPAALLQLARPIFARLQHFVADRDGALAASASDGLLASLLTLQDGVLTNRQNLKFYFDLDEDECSNLLDYARQQGGSLLPQLPHMSKKTLEVVTLNIIRNLLEKVMFLTKIEPNVDALSEAAGINALKQQQDDHLQEAKARCAEAAMALQKEFWPVGEALWMSYGSTSDGADLMQKIGDVWTHGFLLCGPNFSQFVTPIGSLIGRRLSIANSPRYPPAPEAIKVLYDVIKRMGVIFDANTDPSCTSAVNELVRVVEGITNVVFTSITAFRQGGKHAALLASAQTTQQREEIAQAAMKESFIENFSLLDNFFHLLREAVRCIPDRILSSPVFPSVLETLVAGLPFGYGGLADSFLLFTCELCRLDRDPSMAANKQRYLEGLLMAPMTQSALSCSLLGPQSNTGNNTSALESLTRQLLKCISKPNFYDFVYAHRQMGGSSERPVLTEALHGLYMLAPGVIMPMVLTALQDPSILAPLSDHGPITQTAMDAIQKRLFNSVPAFGSLSPSSSLPGPFSSWRDLFTDLLKITRGKTREGWKYLCSEPNEVAYDEDDYKDDNGHDRLLAEDKDGVDNDEQENEDELGYITD